MRMLREEALLSQLHDSTRMRDEALAKADSRRAEVEALQQASYVTKQAAGPQLGLRSVLLFTARKVGAMELTASDPCGGACHKALSPHPKCWPARMLTLSLTCPSLAAGAARGA